MKSIRHPSLPPFTACRGPRGPCGLKLMVTQSRWPMQSRGPRGPCGLKSYQLVICRLVLSRRGPRGPCGLKSIRLFHSFIASSSRPARALWIEIEDLEGEALLEQSRPARALWIEIVLMPLIISIRPGRGPRGPCGLKYIIVHDCLDCG